MLGKGFTGVLLLSALTAVPAWSAEVPRRLADVNRKPLPALGQYPPLPSGFFQLGDRLFFSTAFLEGENALWSTDGTPEGTAVVASGICPKCFAVTPVASLGGVVLLRVSTFSNNLRYWRTDGTPDGTFPVTGPIGLGYEEKVVPGLLPGTGAFYAVDSYQLLRMDGSGTRVVTGPLDPQFPIHSLAAWAGRLYFLSDGRDEGGTLRFGLWSTDGTAEGTRFIAEVHEHSENSALVVPTPSHLFFTSGESGEDLWVTDGTPEGTRLLHDFSPHRPCVGHHRVCPPPAPDVNSMVAVGDKVYFGIYRENGSSAIWESDGTPGGTHAAAELPASAPPDTRTLQRLGGRWLFLSYPASSPSGIQSPRTLWTADDGFSRAEPLAGCPKGGCPAVLGWLQSPDPGHLLFAGTDPAHGVELWITDGTGAGTRRLTDACPGACNGLYFNSFSPVVLGNSQGRTWFLATPDPESTSGDLWVTDGTPAGTRRIAGQTAGVGFLDGRAYFGLFGTDAYASELWTAEGSLRRVTTLKRIPPGSYPVFVPLGNSDGDGDGDGAVLFDATVGERRQLWRSDGTPEGTALVTGFQGRPYGPFTRLGGLYLFVVYKESADGYLKSTGIWRTDGTRSGTWEVVDFGLVPFPDTTLAKVWTGKYLLPVDASPLEDRSLCSYWVSDGSSRGTREIIPPLSGVRSSTGLHPFGSRFLFVSRKEGKGEPVPQLFVSDGTLAGTLQLTNIRGSRPSLETELVQLGKTVFFRIYGLDGGLTGEPELWRTDGTPNGTRRASDLRAVADLQIFQGSLYLTAALGSGPGNRGLFRVDSPLGSPVLIAPVSPPYRPDLPDFLGVSSFIPMGGRLFFSGRDRGDGGGRELWVTDGTAEGTRRVLDVRPGPGSSNPGELTAAGDRVYFAADDGVHGRELWVSDGTAGGTRLVWDLNPGEASSNPLSLTRSGENLFFAADDGETGVEPWVLRLTPR